VPCPLYIDHSADMALGGYAIETTERSIKKTAAFSRYRFELAPGEEVAFAVEEVVTHYSTRRTPRAVRELLDMPQFRRSSDGKGRKDDSGADGGAEVLSAAAHSALDGLVARAERAMLLDKVDKGDVSAADLCTWKEQQALPAALIGRLDELGDLKAKKAEGQRKVAARQSHIEATFTNQTRLRENIKSLEKVGKNALTDRYLTDLDKEEDGLIQTRRAIASLEEEQATLASQISALKLSLASDVRRLREEEQETEEEETDKAPGVLA